MSGVCGWMDLGTADVDKQKLINDMAVPLARFDASPVHTLAGRNGAVAVAAGASCAHVYRQDGLMVAVWGAAMFRSKRLADRAQAEGFAATVAGLYRDMPDDVCGQLSGAFALVIIDEDAGTAVLAIDRMGTHSLTYQVIANCLVFSSSADALIRHPAAKPEIDPQALYNYVYFHMVPGPGTIYKGQQRLLPGECLTFRKGEAMKRRYWQMQFQESDTGGVETHKEIFLELLRKSVREAADGQKIGAFLSGGTDSSTIAGFLTEVGGVPAKTYSIGFEAEGYDEMEYARIASRHFGTDHHEYYVTPDDVVRAIPEIAGVFDQPFGNASAVPAFYCARLARADGLTRMLGGDGGDELFGGNERYAKQHVFALYERLPRLIRKGVMEPAIFGMPAGEMIMPVRKARSYIKQASVPMPARLETYNLLERYGASAVFTPEFLAEARPDQPLALLEQTYNESRAQTLINRMLALDLKVTLADNDLPKVVKACELAGMEVAFPFLNDEMVAFSARLAPDLKLKGTKLRYFFKEALRGILPDEIITKQKHGFGLPFGVWLQKHKALRELATDSLMGLKARGIVQDEFIDSLERRLNEHAGYHGTMVWVLMMMEQWFRQRGTDVS